MATASAGEIVDEYLRYSNSLPTELQRVLSTIRELDERSEAMITEMREMTTTCLDMPPQHSMEANSEEFQAVQKLLDDIEVTHVNAASLSTQKILLAQQAHDSIEQHIKQLDEYLLTMAEDLKREGKFPEDDPAIVGLPLPTGQEEVQEERNDESVPRRARRLEMKRERAQLTDRDRHRDSERDNERVLLHRTHKKQSVPRALPRDKVAQLIDLNKRCYCKCNKVASGEMIACDSNEFCNGGQWFHYKCVGINRKTCLDGEWYCQSCKDTEGLGSSTAATAVPGI